MFYLMARMVGQCFNAFKVEHKSKEQLKEEKKISQSRKLSDIVNTDYFD